MPIHLGIMYDVCRMVHFIATSPTIKPSPINKEMYRLVCAPPCSEVREFRKDTMRPYRVTDTVFKTGHAEDGQYKFIGEPNAGQKAGSTTHRAEMHTKVVRPEQNRQNRLPKTKLQKGDSEQARTLAGMRVSARNFAELIIPKAWGTRRSKNVARSRSSFALPKKKSAAS